MIYMKEEYIVDDKTTNTFYLCSYRCLQISLWRRPTRLSTLEQYEIPNNKQEKQNWSFQLTPMHKNEQGEIKHNCTY